MGTEIIDWDNDNTGQTESITVTLEGEGTVDFQTAFGDYSEARGRGRRRRQKRRLERIRRRQERRALRRAGRRTAMQERQAMRSERKQRRLARREMGKEEEEMPMEEAPMEAAYTEPAVDEGYAEPTYDEGAYYGDTAAEEEAVYDEVGPSDEEAGYTGDYGFDGVRMPSAADQKWDDFYAAEGMAKVNPKVTAITRRIEKNKEFAKQVEGRIFKINARAQSKGRALNTSETATLEKLNMRLGQIRQKIADLEAKLAGFTSFNGDFSNADASTLDENARRRAEVRMAKRAAREERRAFIRAKRKARIAELFAQKKGTMPVRQAMQEARAQARAENPFKVTTVEGAMSAQFSPQKIEVPAQEPVLSEGGEMMPETSEFAGTGLIGVDSYRDYDAPPVRNVELEFSNASGNRKFPWMAIGIGIGVTALGIFVYQKFLRKK